MAFQDGPFVKQEKKGKYAWCACGESAKRPYCDGSHKTKGQGKIPLVVEVTEDIQIAWCGCGKSGKPPYCDGTHAKK
ncbi:MAG: CDGSH iron-sulfur domain-containing protein [Elusimicrobiota bacterium]